MAFSASHQLAPAATVHAASGTASATRGVTSTLDAVTTRTTADLMQAALVTDAEPAATDALMRHRQTLTRRRQSSDRRPAPGGLSAVPDTDPEAGQADLSGLAPTIASPNVDVVTLADTNLVPPDTMGDAGPSQYLVAVNGRVRTINKATGADDGVFPNVTLNAFFESVRQGQQTTNPRVRYDRRSGRWYVLAINLAVPNSVLLAVSSEGTITNSTSWRYFAQANDRRAGGDPGGALCLADFPTLGVDEDALYVGVNQFCGAAIGSLSFDSTSGYVINKASILGAGSAVVTAFHGLASSAMAEGPYTPQGVDNFDSNTNIGYFIGVDNSALGRLQLRRVFNPGGTPTISDNIPIPVADTELPINVPHPGSTNALDAQDDRLNQAVIRGGRLWTNHQIETNAAGQAALGGGRTSIRWYELQGLDATPTVRQSGTIVDAASSNPRSYFMGSVMVSGQGHAALGSTVAGAATFVNAAVTGRLASDPLGQMSGAPLSYSANAAASYNVSVGGSVPNPQSWGGYSYTSVDPNDDMTMWTLQQYVNATNSYALRLVRLQAPPPAPIVSVSPSAVTTGRSSVAITVTGAATAGAGYFDPGPGFANRLTAAFAGSGIAVSDVTVVSPTQVTLTIDTTSAAAGTHQIAITNPDGQMASLGNALTVSANQAPTAVADAFSLRANGTLTVAAPGILGNDTDPNGEVITAVLQSGPSHGSLTLNANGSFSYTPAAGYVGPDTFSYVASDGALSSGVTAVSLTVMANAVPVATPDSYSTAFATPLSVPAPGVLGNDADDDGDPLHAVLVTGPTRGTLVLNADGSFVYTPNAGVAGGDSFVYRASDGAASSTPTTVSLTVGEPTTVQPPSGLVASNVSGNTVTLRWTAPATGPRPTSYVLEGGVSAGGVQASIPTNSTAPIFTFVAPPGSFFVRMHTIAGTERSAASNEIRVHVNVPVTPSAPSGLVGLVNGSTLNLAWRNTFEGGPPSSMLLDVSGAAATTIPLGLSESFGFAGVPGGTYTLRVRALNGGGASPPSNPVTVTFPATCSGAPEPPTEVLAYLTGSTAFIVWNPASTGAAPTSFTVNVSGAFVGSFTTAGRALSGGVGPGNYHLSVVASNACGTSAASPTQTLVVQ